MILKLSLFFHITFLPLALEAGFCSPGACCRLIYLVKVRKFLLPMIVVPHRFLSDRLSNKNQEFRDFVNCKAVPNPDTHQVRNSLLIRF